MKLLANASTLNKGGALQVAVSFIRHALDEPCGIEWHFAVSLKLLEELSHAGLAENMRCITLVDPSPAKSREARRTLRELEKLVSPEIVMTIFGPSYVRFRAPHICGVANPWVTHSTLLAFRTLGLPFGPLSGLVRILYKAYWYRKADFWITEAEAAKIGLVRRLHLPSDRIAIIQNTCGQQYFDQEGVAPFPAPDQKVRILCLSAYYPHKNLEIIPSVARVLQQVDPTLDFEFILTLPTRSEGWFKIASGAKKMGVSHRVCNHGPVPVADGPRLYQNSHIAFLPSVLETFSANYPEAMATGRPIVTTDLDFARDICKQAALYYQPMNAGSAAEAVLKLCRNQVLWDSLVQEGKRVLQGLPTPNTKYRQYVQCILDLQNLLNAGETLHTNVS